MHSIHFELTNLIFIICFVAIDLLFRRWVYNRTDSIAADIIIFANIMAWYDVFSVGYPSNMPLLALIKIQILMIIAITFSLYHGRYLLRKCREVLLHEFDHIIYAETSEEKRELLKRLAQYAVENTPVNISKGYLMASGNRFKEQSRYNLIHILETLQNPYFSKKSSEDIDETFLLNRWVRVMHCISLLFFGLSAIIISSLDVPFAS